MANQYVAPALIFAGVVFSSLITWLIARRNNSGSISTSDAASLWAESNALRAEYKDRAEKLEAQLEEVNLKLKSVMDEMTKLQAKGDKMIVKIDELKKVIAKLRKENERLLAEKKREMK